MRVDVIRAAVLVADGGADEVALRVRHPFTLEELLRAAEFHRAPIYNCVSLTLRAHYKAPNGRPYAKLVTITLPDATTLADTPTDNMLRRHLKEWGLYAPDGRASGSDLVGGLEGQALLL